MAHTITTLKRARQNEKRRENNRAFRSRVHTAIRRVRVALEKKDQQAAREAYRLACSVLDKAAAKGIVHRNSAARQKARLAGHVNRLGK